MKGDEAAFDRWAEENNEKWDAFISWFNPNPLKINDSNKFTQP